MANQTDPVASLVLPTAEDAQRVIQYVEFEWKPPAPLFAGDSSSRTNSNGGTPPSITTTTAGGGAFLGTGNKTVMLPVTEEEIAEVEKEGEKESDGELKPCSPNTRGAPGTQQQHTEETKRVLCEELRTTLLAILSDISVSTQYFAPQPTAAGGTDATAPFLAVGSPKYFFGGEGDLSGSKKAAVIRLRTNAETHQAALRRCQTYFGLTKQESDASGWTRPPLCVVTSFEAFSEASKSLQTWAHRTLEVATNSTVTSPVNGSPTASWETVYDVSDNFILLKARSEVFLTPQAYTYDRRSNARLLHSRHFDSLKLLIRDCDKEATRLRGIETMMLEREERKEKQEQSKAAGGDSSTKERKSRGRKLSRAAILKTKSLFYPRIGEFEYLRDSLQLILNIAITEGELSSLEQFRGLYETLSEEFQLLQAELAGLYMINLPGQFSPFSAAQPSSASITTPSNQSLSSAPALHLPSAATTPPPATIHNSGSSPQSSSRQLAATPNNNNGISSSEASALVDTITRFRAFREKVAKTRKDFLLDMRRQNSSHAPLVQQQKDETPPSWWTKTGRWFSSAANLGKAILVCQAEVPQTTGKSPLIEQKETLLRCFDDLWAHTESTAVLLEKKYPELFSRKWGFAEQLHSLTVNLSKQLTNVTAKLASRASSALMRLPGISPSASANNRITYSPHASSSSNRYPAELATNNEQQQGENATSQQLFASTTHSEA